MRSPWIILGLFFCLTNYVYVTQNLDPSRTAAVRAHGDGFYYYVYLRSLLYDRDVNFSNDYQLMGNPFNFGLQAKTKKPINKFTIGPTLYWLPFALGAHLYCYAQKLINASDAPVNGTSLTYQKIVFWGSLFWGFAALVLLAAYLRPRFGAGIVTVTALGLAVASPLGWYMIRQPSFSHAISAFATATFVLFWHKTYGQRSLRQWAILGALAGLTMLVRPQNIGHVILPWGEWMLLFVIAWRQHQRDELKKLLGRGTVFVACAVLAFAPQMAAWQIIYGYPITIPQGNDFMYWGHPMWIEVLFSSRHGLFAWSPLLYLGFIGLIMLCFKKEAPGAGQEPGPRHPVTPARLMLLALLTQVYLNGCAADWWGGWAFGGRRFMSCIVYFGFGLAALLHWLVELIQRKSDWFSRAIPVVLVACFILPNLSLMEDYLSSRAKHGESQDMGPLWQRALTDGFDKTYRTIGNVGSIPANWIFALHAGVSPDRYDSSSGIMVFDDGDSDHIRFSDARLALGGFAEEVSSYKSSACRWVEGKTATFILPLRKPVPIKGELSLCSARPGTRVKLRIAGKTVMSTAVTEAWKTYRFRIPRSCLGSGMNYVQVEQDLPPPLSWPVGQTGIATKLEIAVESAGFSVGKQAIFTMGPKPQTEKGRGIIVYTVNATQWTSTRLGVFDTHGQAEETERLVQLIAALPQGTIVALAVSDEASKHWSKAADNALRSLGGKDSLLERYRWSYALIGVKGAQPGQAIESLQRNQRARAIVGRLSRERVWGVAWADLKLQVDTSRSK